MTPSIDQTLHHLANLLPNRTLLPILTLLPNFGGFHRTMQRVRLANRGRLLLRTPGPVRFGTCICSNVETILSWTCHVYGPFEFRTPLGTSILLQCSWYRYSSINCKCPLLPLESRHYSSRDWASPVSKSWYYWDIVKWSTQQPTTSKQPTNNNLIRKWTARLRGRKNITIHTSWCKLIGCSCKDFASSKYSLY